MRHQAIAGHSSPATPHPTSEAAIAAYSRPRIGRSARCRHRITSTTSVTHPEGHRDRPRQPDEQRHGRRDEPPLPRQRVEVADEQEHRERLGVGQLQRHRRGEAGPQRDDEVCRRVADAVAQQQPHEHGRAETADQRDRRRDDREAQTGDCHDGAGEVGKERVEGPRVLTDLAGVGDAERRGIAVLGDDLVPLPVPERREREVADRHVVAARHAARHLVAHDDEQDRRRDDARQRIDREHPRDELAARPQGEHVGHERGSVPSGTSVARAASDAPGARCAGCSGWAAASARSGTARRWPRAECIPDVAAQHRDLLVLLAQLAPEAVDDPVDLAHPVAAQPDVEDEVVEVGVHDLARRAAARARGCGSRRPGRPPTLHRSGRAPAPRRNRPRRPRRRG